MIAYTLIGPRRCACSAVVFHVAKCPLCGARTDTHAKALIPPPYTPPPLPQPATEPSEQSKTVAERIARSKLMKQRKLERTNAGQAVEAIRRARKGVDRWATEYLKRNKGAV